MVPPPSKLERLGAEGKDTYSKAKWKETLSYPDYKALIGLGECPYLVRRTD